MRRALFLFLMMLIFMSSGVMLSPGASIAQEGPPPTNTPRGTPAAPTASLTPTTSDTPTNTLTPTSSDTPTDTLTPSPTITPTTIGPYNYPEDINSLTGLPYPDETAKNRRTLILKVSNFPEVVRPQYGLSKADVVFEYEVEGGVTRFAALFRSQGAERVGSIRSARLMDIELVTAYQAVLGYSGSNEWIRQYILTESDWRWRAFSPQIGNNCPLFCRIREDSRPFEHTLFANTYAIWDEAERIGVNQGMKAYGFTFNDQADPAEMTASDIHIDWYSDRAETRWQYNPTDAKYYRWDSGLPHIDAGTGEQITADNIILLEVWHVDRPDVYESEIGGIALEHQIWGRSRAWVFRDGLWYEGEWYRNRDRGGILIWYNDGERTPINLKPGQTWVEIVRKINIVDRGDMFSVTISDDQVDAAATAVVVENRLTSVPAMTQTQFATWYGSPTPSQTWTPTPTGTWQH